MNRAVRSSPLFRGAIIGAVAVAALFAALIIRNPPFSLFPRTGAATCYFNGSLPKGGQDRDAFDVGALSGYDVRVEYWMNGGGLIIVDLQLFDRGRWTTFHRTGAAAASCPTNLCSYTVQERFDDGAVMPARTLVRVHIERLPPKMYGVVWLSAPGRTSGEYLSPSEVGERPYDPKLNGYNNPLILESLHADRHEIEALNAELNHELQGGSERPPRD